MIPCSIIYVRRLGVPPPSHSSPTHPVPLTSGTLRSNPVSALFAKYPKLETGIYFGFWCDPARGWWLVIVPPHWTCSLDRAPASSLQVPPQCEIQHSQQANL